VKTIHGEAPAREGSLSALLAYDRFRRVSLLDGVFSDGVALDPLSPWDAAHAALGGHAMRHSVHVATNRVEVTCELDRLDPLPLAVDKRLSVPREGPSLDIRYRLRWAGSEPLAARWAVQFNLTLSAGDAPGRYFRLPDRPSLGSRGRLEGQRALAMVDEWLGLVLELDWAEAGEVAWAPVETVSLSETGFERIYQGSALLVSWPLRLGSESTWEMTLRLTARQAPQ
jgi:4-alpha-glucanotransferase